MSQPPNNRGNRALAKRQRNHPVAHAGKTSAEEGMQAGQRNLGQQCLVHTQQSAPSLGRWSQAQDCQLTGAGLCLSHFIPPGQQLHLALSSIKAELCSHRFYVQNTMKTLPTPSTCLRLPLNDLLLETSELFALLP